MAQSSGASFVIAVARALAILDAFKPGETQLTLGELARRTRLHKTTVLRIARTLAATRYLVQLRDGAWRLGPAAGWLGTRYHRNFDERVVIEPVLRELTRKTQESAAFYVREGDSRICVVRVDGPQPVRYHARLGEVLPLDRGAPGRVLLAYSGEPGEPYESVRRAGCFATFGERDPAVGSVAAPVFGENRVLAGAVAITAPISRFTRQTANKYARLLKVFASRLTAELGGRIITVRRLR
ncbi:MAG TPA: IclR family transcriptional regulator [Burkholderiales bacterium]|nr:IclR family transcriptional regulator [Burkholderiales bacterium]